MKIGIDLGTTNSALAYIDEREAEDREFPPLHIFETPQLVAAGRVEPRRTLPSFLFLEDGQPVGVYAREQGALVPPPPPPAPRRAGRRRPAPHFAVVPLPGRRTAGRRLRSRTGGPRAHAPRPL